MRIFIHHLVRAITHPPVQRATQRIARGGDQYRGPKQVRVEFDKPEHHRLRAQRQQRRRDEGDQKYRAQAESWQGQQFYQVADPDFHECSSIGSKASRPLKRLQIHTQACR